MVWPRKTGFIIRLTRMGCKNRPFYQLGALPARRRPNLLPDEVIGNVDPIPNEHNEIIASADLKRLSYWMGKGSMFSNGAKDVLGMAGWFPINPRIYIRAVDRREAEIEAQLKKETSEEDKDEEKEKEFVIEPLIATKRLV